MVARFKGFWPRIRVLLSNSCRCSTAPPTKLQQTVHSSSYSFREWGFVAIFKKNYHPVCILPDYFKAPSWADWREDIHTSHWESGLSPVSSLDESRPLPSICDSLTHKAVISRMHQPPRKVSLGIMAYLRRIKNVLDRLAASLIPRSHSSHFAVLYVRALAHDISNSHGQVSHCGMLVLSLTLQIS